MTTELIRQADCYLVMYEELGEVSVHWNIVYVGQDKSRHTMITINNRHGYYHTQSDYKHDKNT
jgi:hypothetical protein